MCEGREDPGAGSEWEQLGQGPEYCGAYDTLGLHSFCIFSKVKKRGSLNGGTELEKTLENTENLYDSEETR